MAPAADALRKLVAGTLLASFTGPTVPAWLGRRIEAGLGGVCLFGSNLLRADTRWASGDQAAADVAAALHAVRPAVLVALDEEGGAVTRLEASTGSSVPGSAALGAVDDVDLTRRVAAALGDRLRACGIDLDLAPVADVNVDAANPVIGVRAFGADPALVARHVAGFVSGLQSAGVAACVKHFPGHGATAVDSHLDLPVLDVTADELDRRELVPFRTAVAAGTATIMTGHLRVPALDPDHPATVSRRILTDLLRTRLGFASAVVTDALDMEGIGGPDAIPANVVRALAAGADLCCLGPDATDELVGACIDAVVGALHSGALDEERLVDAAARVAAIARPTVGPAPWMSTAAVTGGPDGGLAEIGRVAAERALRIDGELTAPVRGAHVVELRRAPMIAAGAVPWGVAGPLAELDPTATVQRLADPGGLPTALDGSRGRPLVVVVRDPQSNPQTASLLAALVEARPDAVVVDMGWPAAATGRADPGSGRPRITTYGPSLASAEAVARLLIGGTGTGQGRDDGTDADARSASMMEGGTHG